MVFALRGLQYREGSEEYLQLSALEKMFLIRVESFMAINNVS